MPKKKRTRKHHQPTREFFTNLSLAEQVRRATPMARKLIDGIEHYDDIHMFDDHVADVLQDDRIRTMFDDLGEENGALWSERLHAAKAIGIALGLMLRPEAFTGGAR